jgi:hypothetical protein
MVKSIKISFFFWYDAEYSPKNTGRHFGGVHCLHHQRDYYVIIVLMMEAVSISETSVSIH